MDNSNYQSPKELSDTFYIDIYEIKDDKLYILGHNITYENITLKANSKKIKFNKLYFNIPEDEPQKYFSEFKIAISHDEEIMLEFECENKNLKIDFSKHCNFSKIIKYAKTRKYLSILKDNKIIITNKTTFKWIKQEAKSIFNLIKHPKRASFIVIPFRIGYILSYPFLKNKHIWFFMDRPKIADDNGLHLFKYAQDKDKNIKKYFILDKNNKEFNEIKKTGNVLAFQSVKHRFLTLFAENIITSHPENQIIYPFWRSFEYYAGLLKSNTLFLQHGIIKDDISGWLNKSQMNLGLFVTSSPKEYKSVLENNYNYDENIVKMLGLPRFDNLRNDETKKQILIMPSWRNYLTDCSFDEISESELFKHFNSLINNENLIKNAEKYDYEIIFKPHPQIYKFIDLFDENDYVKIASKDEKYQELFNKSALMITDYSSVAFDFAYLKKPVIYYQYSDDYHFSSKTGYFKYDTMGFGEIIENESELIDLTEKYMQDNCKMKDKYIKRVEDFFTYTDKNNCKRVYDHIKEIPLKD